METNGWVRGQYWWLRMDKKENSAVENAGNFILNNRNLRKK
jgi:hypothetical protein